MRAKPVPGQQYASTKWPAPKRPQTPAKGPIIELPAPSWSHGVDTQKYETEGELEGDRY